MLGPKPFHGLHLIIMLFPQHPKLGIPLLLLCLILAITPMGRSRTVRAGVSLIRHGLEFRFDIAPLSGEDGGSLRPVLIGGPGMSTRGGGFFVGFVVVVGVGGVWFVDLSMVGRDRRLRSVGADKLNFRVRLIRQ